MLLVAHVLCTFNKYELHWHVVLWVPSNLPVDIQLFKWLLCLLTMFLLSLLTCRWISVRDNCCSDKICKRTSIFITFIQFGSYTLLWGTHFGKYLLWSVRTDWNLFCRVYSYVFTKVSLSAFLSFWWILGLGILINI